MSDQGQQPHGEEEMQDANQQHPAAPPAAQDAAAALSSAEAQIADLQAQLAAAHVALLHAQAPAQNPEPQNEWASKTLPELLKIVGDETAAYVYRNDPARPPGVGAPTMDAVRFSGAYSHLMERALTNAADVQQYASDLVRISEAVALITGKANERAVNPALTSPIPKVPKPQLLHGKGHENVELWLANMQLYLNLTRVPAADWADVAYLSLREAAAECLDAERTILVAAGKAFDWNAFQTAILKYFGIRNPEQKARADLDALKLTGGMSIEKYSQTFNALCAKIRTHAMSDLDKVHLYVQGLPLDLKKRVAVDPVTREPWQDVMMLQKFTINTCAHDTALTPKTHSAEILKGGNRSARKREASGEWQAAPGSKKPRQSAAPDRDQKIEAMMKRWKTTRPETEAAFDGGRCLSCGQYGHLPNPSPAACNRPLRDPSKEALPPARNSPNQAAVNRPAGGPKAGYKAGGGKGGNFQRRG